MVKEIVRKFKDEPSSGMFKVKYRENILLQRFWASTKRAIFSIKMKTPSVSSNDFFKRFNSNLKSAIIKDLLITMIFFLLKFDPLDWNRIATQTLALC
jgi:hypothetical protein